MNKSISNNYDSQRAQIAPSPTAEQVGSPLTNSSLPKATEESSSFHTNNPQAELENVTRSAHGRRRAPLADPRIVMGELHITHAGANINTRAACVLNRNLNPSISRNLNSQGLTAFFREGDRTIYYQPVAGARTAIFDITRGNGGSASFEAMIRHR